MQIDGENDGIDNELPELESEEGLDDLGTEEGADGNEGDAAPARGADKPAKPLSLRDALIKATKDAQQKADPAATSAAARAAAAAGKNGVPKDPSTGKFQKKEGQAAPVIPAAGQPPAPGASQPLTPSTRFPAEMRAELAKLPPAVIQQLNAREEQVQRELTVNSEERKMGTEFNKVVAPYIAQIRSEGATPISAVAELFNMAYFLRNPTITPQSKGEMLWRTAQQFGADMRRGQQQMAQQPFNPQLQAVTQQVTHLQQQLKQQEDQKKAAEQDAVNRQIGDFRADTTAHPHFDAVALDMAALLAAGRASNMQDAYEKACYANPEIRSIVQVADATATEQKRVAEQKAKADAAKKAGLSVRGGPGSGVNKNGNVRQKSLRDEIAANFRAVSES